MGTFINTLIIFSLAVTIPSLLYYHWIVCLWAERDCLPLLKVWMEENGLTLLRQRLYPPFFQPELLSDSLPTVLFRVIVEDTQGRRRTGWTAITGRPSCGGEFFPRDIAVRWGRPAKAAASKPKKEVACAKGKSLWDDWVDLA